MVKKVIKHLYLLLISTVKYVKNEGLQHLYTLYGVEKNLTVFTILMRKIKKS